TKCAAGVAGLIKAVLSVRHGLLPPTLHLNRPNEAYSKSSPFSFRAEKTGFWNEDRRVAGVSGFGFGGTNFHTIVENYAPERPKAPLRAWPSELFLFRGGSPEEAFALMGKVSALLAANNKLKLRDIAKSLSVYNADKAPQYVIVAGTRAELLSRIEAVLAANAGGGVSNGGDNAADDGGEAVKEKPKDPEGVYRVSRLDGKVAFLFSGQGSQRVNMAAELFMAFPKARRLLEAAPEYERILFPDTVFSSDEKKAQRDRITDTRNAQPLLGAVDFAIAELLRDFGVQADMAAGHSYGELPALCFAGVFHADELLGLSRARAESILSAAGADPGRMVAVRADAATVEKLLSGMADVWAVNLNGPRQTVVAGTSEGITALIQKLEAEKVNCTELNVACAFHSPILADAEGLFAQALKTVRFKKPGLPVWSNTTADLYPDTAAGIRKRLAEHLVNPVRFAEQTERMYQDGARVFIEAGPGGVLTGLVGAILKDKEIAALQTERGDEEGLTYFLRGLARYIATGREIDMEKLFDGRDATLLNLDEPESYKKNGTVWNIDGGRAVPERGELPAHAEKPMSGPILTLGAPNGGITDRTGMASLSGSELSGVLMAYLNNMNAMIQDQRDVILGCIGQPDLIPRAQYAPRQQFAILSGDAIAQLPDRSAADSEGGTTQTGVDAASQTGADTPAEGAQPDDGLPDITTLSTEQIQTIVLEVVSEKTGFPADMLGLDVDLEAELSIDSIKKIEIIGGLRDRVKMPGNDENMEAAFEKTIAIRTLREMIAWIEELGSKAADGGANEDAEAVFTGAKSVVGDVADEAAADLAGKDTAVGGVGTADGGHSAAAIAAREAHSAYTTAAPGPAATDIVRMILTTAELPVEKVGETQAARLKGKSFAVTDDGGGLAADVVAALKALGASARPIIAAPDGGFAFTGRGRPAAVDGLVLINAAASPAHYTIHNLFGIIKQAGIERLQWIFTFDDTPGALLRADTMEGVDRLEGFSGFIKSLAHEYPGKSLCAVGFHTAIDPAAFAGLVVDELANEKPFPEVYYDGARRFRFQPVVTADTATADTAEADTAADGAGSPVDFVLDKNANVLVLGGAQGITPPLLARLAESNPCHYILVGRSAPAPENDVYGGMKTVDEIRKYLIETEEMKRPKAIETKARKIFKENEVKASIALIEKTGAKVSYHSVDVSDAAAFRAFLTEAKSLYGSIDGVIHAAAILEDKLFRDKEADSFYRVYNTKTGPLTVILTELLPELKLFVLFSSIASSFGSVGQCDYAAGNSVFDTVSVILSRKYTELKSIAFNWGPWKGAGMVNAGLENEFRKKGIALLPLDKGAAFFANELLRDNAAEVLAIAGDASEIDGFIKSALPL
ncbi:MAG: SDR family NAD(P)-dependent oxidoreductase, partial [Clostridiales bacterium]|nr:SDR family NAD(P)-dependent oxidoreductase [Clostridiales bacterium]